MKVIIIRFRDEEALCCEQVILWLPKKIWVASAPACSERHASCSYQGCEFPLPSFSVQDKAASPRVWHSKSNLALFFLCLLQFGQMCLFRRLLQNRQHLCKDIIL